MLVNTHAHLDHTGGNFIFDDVTVLAHVKSLELLRNSLGPRTAKHWMLMDFASKARLLWGQNLLDLVPEGDPALAWCGDRIGTPEYDVVTIAPPTETFADTFEVNLPDDVVRLGYWGPAHGDGDITVHIVKRKVLFMGDLMFYRRFPWMGDCNLNGWISRLTEALSLDVDVIIPGHGPPTDKSEVLRFRSLFVALRREVDKAIGAGFSKAAAMQSIVLPEFAHLPRYEQWRAINIKAAYRYLKGQ